MKKIYTLSLLFSVLLFAGCSKDFLKSYDTRIVGTWRITDVNRIGFGGNTDKLPFTNGTFNFYEDGKLTYVNEANVTYQGSWNIEKRVIEDETVRRLQVSAVDFNTQQILTEFYDDITFVGTNHFKAEIS